MSTKIRSPFYGTYEWTKLSKSFRVNNPLCKMCAERGIVRVGEYVDHIVPILIDFDLRFAVSNLQTLCSSCHQHKTHMIDNQLLKGLEPKPMRGTRADGLPIDANHPWNKN